MGSETLKRLAVFEINRIRKMEKKQARFLEELEKRQEEFFEKQLEKKSDDDYLTVKELTKEFNISLSTFKRYRNQGLNVLQNGFKARIMVRRGDFVEFIKERELW